MVFRCFDDVGGRSRAAAPAMYVLSRPITDAASDATRAAARRGKAAAATIPPAVCSSARLVHVGPVRLAFMWPPLQIVAHD